MGIILGVEAAVGIAEAAEGVEAAEAITAASDAEGAISSGSSVGEAAGSEAGDGAAGAVQSGGDALASALQTLNEALAKLSKMVEEYIVIDTVFKTAKKILLALSSDPSARARAKKLEKLIKVLSQSSNLLTNLTEWLKVHSQDTTDINDITVTMQGVLSKFLPRLGSAASTLKILSSQISQKNLKKEPVTDGEINASEHSLQTVLSSFKSLAEFKTQHKDKVPRLD
ncbi:hypothetical protein ACROYT_G034192 [Oculina patagonica]